MIEVAVGLGIMAVLLVIMAVVGEVMSHLTEGFGCVDFWDAVGNGFCWTVAIGVVLLIAWLAGELVMVHL